MALIRVRIAIVVLMGLTLSLVAGGVFDDFLPVLLVPPLVAGAAALAVTTRRWPVRVMVAAGGVIGSTLLTAILAGGSWSDAFPGVLSGPRRLLTTEWPSPTEPSVVATVAIVLAVSTAVAADLAGRVALHLAPLLPLLVGLVVLIGLGAPLRPASVLIGAFGVLALLLALARPGDLVSRRARLLAGERTLAVTAVAIAATAVAAGTILAFDDRADPRMIEDAELSAPLLDPVEAMVALREAEPAFALYSVTDRSLLVGRSVPARWRLAALEVYDGQRWVPRLTLRPIGGRLGLASPTVDGTPPLEYTLEFLTDEIDLIPFPGRPLWTDRDVETDLDRVVVRLDEPAEPGTVVRAVSEVAPSLADAGNTEIGFRQVDEIAREFTETANLIAGVTDDTAGQLDKLLGLEATMRDEWVLDPSAPGGGQQLALIRRFIEDTQRGTEEQFVTAFVLLARSLGVDARIATGFVVPVGELRIPLELRSAHAAVWPEVRLAELGWLAFDPVPPIADESLDEPTQPLDQQSPAAAQPPNVPPTEEGNENDDDEETSTALRERWDLIREWLLRWGAWGLVGVLPLIGVVSAILLLKWWRRRRRLRVADPALRIRGAWANATDSLVDAGLDIAPAWTDARIAERAAPLAPSVPGEMRRLATMSTAMTFGITDGASSLATDAVVASDAVDQAIRVEQTRWQRMRWRLSLRSLRRSTRSPVSADL